jgi:hypothetical protein
VIGLIAALVGYVGVQHFLHRGVTIPGSIAGVPRMHGAVSDTFEQQMQTQAEKYDVQMDAAVFGASGTAEFLVVVINGSSVDTADELFQSFTRGIAQSGATVGSDKSQGELKGATYRCEAASGNGVQIGTCMWRTDDHVGFVLDPNGDIKSAEQLTSQVYRAIG